MSFIDWLLECLGSAFELAAGIFILVAACDVFGFDGRETLVMVLALIIGYLVFWD